MRGRAREPGGERGKESWRKRVKRKREAGIREAERGEGKRGAGGWRTRAREGEMESKREKGDRQTDGRTQFVKES